MDLIVLGSTGSVGRSALEVCRSLGPDVVRVVGLAAGSNARLLREQAQEFGVRRVALARGDRGTLAGIAAPLVGEDAAERLVHEVACDGVVAAIAGAAGLPAVLAAARRGVRICLANKESLVVAGAVVRRIARQHGAELVPVDSEHSGVFQCLRAGSAREVRRVTLTASGGPFRTWPAERLAAATPEEALAHPTWSMGPLITVDSATLVNKALELIEARWLFDLEPAQLRVVVHPQSIVHALVEFCDGSVVAQMAAPDMRIPIQYALTHPGRRPLAAPPLDLGALGALNFEDVDGERFPAIGLAFRALELGGAAGAVFNAANEVARAAFLDGALAFPMIVATVAHALDLYASRGPAPAPAELDLEDVLAADAWAREEACRWISA